MRTIAWMIIAASARVALAQPGGVPEATPAAAPPDPTTHPGFVVIDQTDASSAAGFQLSYVTLDSGTVGPSTLLRVAAHARYVDPASGLGGYVRIPFAYASSSGLTGNTTDVGDLEIGGIFSPRLNAGELGVILRAGVTLPTGESGLASSVGSTTNFLALPDLYNSLPRATTVKLGVSPVVRSGRLFARVDLGLDWNLDAKDLTVGKALHFDLGVGADLGPVAVMLESENATLFSDRPSVDSETVDAFAVSARLNARPVAPYLAVVLPVDDNLTRIFGFMLTAGLEIRQ